jgi:hypothetical protein
VQVLAALDRLGELRLDFRVKRVKSVLIEEPFAESLDDIYSDSVIPVIGPSFFNLTDDMLEDTRDTIDSEICISEYLEEPSSSYVLSDVDSDRPDVKSEENDRGPALNPKSVAGPVARDEPLAIPVLSAPEASFSTIRDQFLDDSSTPRDVADRLRRVLNLDSAGGGAVVALPYGSVLPGVDLREATSGREDSIARQGLPVDVQRAFTFEPTMKRDSDGVWYTFSFRDTKVEQGLGRSQLNGDLDKQV